MGWFRLWLFVFGAFGRLVLVWLVLGGFGFKVGFASGGFWLLVGCFAVGCVVTLALVFLGWCGVAVVMFGAGLGFDGFWFDAVGFRFWLGSVAVWWWVIWFCVGIVVGCCRLVTWLDLVFWLFVAVGGLC